MNDNLHLENRAVIERYARRTREYDPLEPWVAMTRQELERAIVRVLRLICPVGTEDTRLIEIGCGSGRNLLQFLRLGFRPHNLVGIDLLKDRVREARLQLPATVRIESGDAVSMSDQLGQFDIVFQSLVFSSLLDDEFQCRLATRMWDMTAPGGGILWYDFVFDNPANSDVRGVRLRRVRELFPAADMQAWRVTLAPPISRRVSAIHPAAYTIFNALPFLRTHRLCWLRKPA